MKGKCVLALCMALVLSLCAVPVCAYASDYDSYADEYYSKCRVNKEEFSYWMIQEYVSEGGRLTHVFTYCRVPIAYCTKYTNFTYGYRTCHPSNSDDDGSSYIHMSDTDMAVWKFRLDDGSVEYVGHYGYYYNEHTELSDYKCYSNHDIVNFETGEVVFRVAPSMAELAEVVEQSTRQKNPMSQVIFLLPLGIFLVVSFLALRKCFKMLRTIFSQG